MAVNVPMDAVPAATSLARISRHAARIQSPMLTYQRQQEEQGGKHAGEEYGEHAGKNAGVDGGDNLATLEGRSTNTLRYIDEKAREKVGHVCSALGIKHAAVGRRELGLSPAQTRKTPTATKHARHEAWPGLY